MAENKTFIQEDNTMNKNQNNNQTPNTLLISALLWMSIFIIDALTAGLTVFG